MDQAARCERRNVGDVAIVKPPFQFQHCAEPLQEHASPVGIDIPGGLHHGLQLAVA
jgi:hypothetical protein